jgi:hypothetical protein
VRRQMLHCSCKFSCTDNGLPDAQED